MASQNCVVRLFHELDQVSGPEAFRSIVSKHASLSLERERAYYGNASPEAPLFSAVESQRLDELYYLLNTVECEREYLRTRAFDAHVGIKTHKMMLGIIYKCCPFDWALTQFIMEYMPAVDIVGLVRSEERVRSLGLHPEYP